MSDIAERELGGLDVRIDRLLCVGFGDCIEEAADVFEFDDEGIVRFRDDAPEIERDRLIRACDVCPVDALAVLDEDGRTIVPS